MIQVVSVMYDEDSMEADVKLSSDGVCIECYCHPISSREMINESLGNNLIAFNVQDVIADDNYTPAAIKTPNSYYSYCLRGAVISKTKIKINDFIIDIGAIPKDIDIGTFVSCSCMRLTAIL